MAVNVCLSSGTTVPVVEEPTHIITANVATQRRRWWLRTDTLPDGMRRDVLAAGLAIVGGSMAGSCILHKTILGPFHRYSCRHPISVNNERLLCIDLRPQLHFSLSRQGLRLVSQGRQRVSYEVAHGGERLRTGFQERE